MESIIKTDNVNVVVECELKDNKAMVTPVHAGGRPPPSLTAVQIDSDKSTHGTNKPQKTSRCLFRRRIRLPYTINTVLIILVLSLLFLLEVGYIPATKNGFYCKDPSLSQPYTGDTIRGSVLILGNLLVIPAVVLLLTEYLRKGSFGNICFHELWYFYREFFTGVTLTIFLTEIGKVLIGEPRPMFFDVCKPDAALNCTVGEYVAQWKCTSTEYSDYFLSDSSRSFPSGHASTSVFVGLFFSYVIQTRLPTLKTGRIFKPFFVSVLLTWSLVCSLSRITDKRHHWWDVLAGVVLAILCVTYSISIIHKKLTKSSIPRVTTSTTTLLDVKNKDAKSEVI